MKKRVKAGFLLVGFFLLWSCSSATAPPSTSTGDEETIIALERQWAEAIVNKDVATLNEIIADDFTGTSWTGDTYSKTKAMTDIEFRVFVAESLNLEDVKVSIFGDTAVVTMIQVEKSKYENIDCSGRYGYSDVWVKRDGRWQAVSSYGRIA
jgi:ketosteroid isomerase-like protein